MTTLREALAQPEPEPVAWMDREGDLYKMPEIEGWAPPHTMLYTHPPQSKPLTKEALDKIIGEVIGWNSAYGPEESFARAIERAHGIGEKE